MIPETIVFYGGIHEKFEFISNHIIIFIFQGVPKLWLFNSSKNKGNLILKKNNDKLNIFGIIQGFSKIRIDKEKADNLLLLKETVRNLPQKVFICFLFRKQWVFFLGNAKNICKIQQRFKNFAIR